MKVHFINILLFALPLNILEHNQRNHKSPTSHTPKIPTIRSLCECELYAPVNYDNDLQMKEVMDNFNKQAQQRLNEYDERMQEKRKQCKDQCDKESQKIILKDKLEKELMDKFATLHTDMQSDAIPTCVCEKSMVDKMEKFCLNCGMNVGGGVTLSSGVLGGIGGLAVNAWKDAAIVTATAAAEKFGAAKGAAAGLKAGVDTVIAELEKLGVLKFCPQISKTFFIKTPYTNAAKIASTINAKYSTSCNVQATGDTSMCSEFRIDFGIWSKEGSALSPPPDHRFISETVTKIVEGAKGVAETTEAEVTLSKATAFEKAQEKAIESASTQLYNGIGYSVLAIIIIVLIMVIIYLILRYRRKKKMKKKLQYIKLLEE
ncbi:rifin [Plasmodium reichenowi]|uniref:Rifin n=1 Tax=Plasmodium reichenowi TaxID=5854 RepID=A0A060RLY2_PLARE|nr:rifin [Plasmodium reichenowi]